MTNLQADSAAQSNLTPSDLPSRAPTPLENVTIRHAEATDSDAAAIAHVGWTVFETTFGHTCTPSDMTSYLESNFTTQVIRRELDDPDKTFIVCCVGDEIVAFSLLTEGSHEPAVENLQERIELQRVYVDTAYHGSGIAKKLMDSTLEFVRNKGFKHIWLGVWEHNERAFRFYQRYGFSKVGSHDFWLGSERQTDWIAAKKL